MLGATAYSPSHKVFPYASEGNYKKDGMADKTYKEEIKSSSKTSSICGNIEKIIYNWKISSFPDIFLVFWNAFEIYSHLIVKAIINEPIWRAWKISSRSQTSDIIRDIPSRPTNRYLGWSVPNLSKEHYLTQPLNLTNTLLTLVLCQTLMLLLQHPVWSPAVMNCDPHRPKLSKTNENK